MKLAKYEGSPGALAAFLASRPQSAMVCDLYTFALQGSVNGAAPLLYTTADTDITVPYSPGTWLVETGPPLAAPPAAVGPTMYSSTQVYFDQLRNKAHGDWKIGLDVDTWQVICTPTPQATIGGQPFLAALRAGALDGAVVAVDRAYFDNRDGTALWTDFLSPSAVPMGVVNVFTGRVAEIDLGRSSAVISINSHLELLNQNMPRNLYQAGCRWQLFSAGCTLNAEGYVRGGEVASPPSVNSNLLSVNLDSPDVPGGTYALGRLVMAAGANNGFSRSIRSWIAGSPATFTLMAPFPFAMTTGERILLYPGCDKTLNACDRFGNRINFGGMSFIPAPEMAV